MDQPESPRDGTYQMGVYGFPVRRPAVGMKIRPKPRFIDIIRGDGEPVPPALQPHDAPALPPVYIGFDRYLSREFVELEREHIWAKQWQVACREEDIPEIGDRIDYEIVDRSFLIVRTSAGEIKAFHNSCRHRGRKLCSGRQSGAECGSVIRCPFHAWTWNLDGTLKWVPDQEDFPYLRPESYGLDEVPVGRWGGNVFINPDRNAVPFAETLGVLPEIFADFPAEERYTVMHFRKHVRCNWKITQEAFMEGYHVIETHWDGLPFFGSSFPQCDIWETETSHVNHLVTPSVVPNSWVEDIITPQDSAEQFCAAWDLPKPLAGSINTIAEARRYCAGARRRVLEEAYGQDLSDRPSSYFLEMSKYFIFPNFHPWWGEALPWWYRFLPYGDDPDSSIMEVRVTAPLPRGAPRPPVAPIIDIDFDTLTSDVPELGVVGQILQQDMTNLVEIQKGLKSARKGNDVMTLASYQENNIQHFHHVYNRLLGID